MRTVSGLVGEILTHVDDFGDEIVLTTQSGRKIHIFHSQDCCESVGILGTEGEWTDLIGKVLVDVTEEINPDNDEIFAAVEHDDSYTDTKFTFRVDGATVVNRWIGDSNGYYSESVDIVDITKGRSSL